MPKKHHKHKPKIHRDETFLKLNSFKIALILGLMGSVYMLLLAILNLATGKAWGSVLIRLISSLYLGYDTTLEGIILGMMWAFADFFVAGLIFGFLYNKLPDLKLK